ncbi:HAD-like protein [Coniochaeta ligniaria NRRL 30616]|uniref:HAD-like protein n=1 Tax=Coniochaeta ligniaria NRRL 30616 TaxID=1408157 RepID=A0A1J7I900_9PEZI|nr:HAD-like protein [Coniochaeta ligniaria NRRL 30616]
MSTSTQSPDLTTFKALSFDCYGTLIDWESGLISDLASLLSQLPATHPYVANPLVAVERFNHFSHELWLSQPKQLYNDNLISSYKSLAAELGVSLPPDSEVEKIGTAPGRWAPFPDTVEGLQRLNKHYKLIILSNVSNENIERTVKNQLAPAKIDGVYTAENIGSYKPSLNNFRYLFEHAKSDFGVDKEKGELLHVAVSLVHDHVPAKQIGLRSAWIARGGGEEGDYRCAGPVEKLTKEGKLGFEWRFETIGEFADEVERQFAVKK